MIHYTAHIKFLFFAILFFGTAAEIFAAEGDLDSSFGSDGIVTTDNGSRSEQINDIAVQPDGKIIAVGVISINSALQTVFVRYNANGSIDSLFGTSGKVIIESVFVAKLALQPNGKIVIVGSDGRSPNFNSYVARLNSDGSFDTTFNGTGTVTLDLRGTNDSLSSVKILPDGKILTGGSSARPAPDLRSDFAIIRFNADGSLDTTFDGDGKVFTMIPPTGESAGIADLAVQPDGKILAAGSVSVVDTPGDDPDRIFAVVRYNANGSLDTTFDGDGVANPRFLPASGNGITSTSVPTNIFAQNDGKILVVGNASTCCAPFPTSKAALVRFNADGSFDTTFASGGKALISFPADFFSVGKASIQTDNKIVIAGSTGNIKQRFVAVARLTSDGALDLTFSGDGRTNIVPSLSNTTASTVALQPDGK
ncbi:MAG: delta-60 repeat domain-containing protein, partial [Acidobacteriota bacterium]|nr:delta-60 repeat domain-containing protein [Acidobacteriota bacterium]